VQGADSRGEEIVTELENAVNRLDLTWEKQQRQFMVSGFLLHHLFRPAAKGWQGPFPAQDGQWLAYGALGVIYGVFSSILALRVGWICWLFVLQALFIVGCAIYGSSRAKAYHRAAADYREARERLTAKIAELQLAGRE